MGKMETVESLLAFCHENNRVCPQPAAWNQLYGMLPDKKRSAGGWEPPLPVILAAWAETPSLAKELRLAEHVRWAQEKGCLERIGVFLRSLDEKDWHHLGESPTG